MRCFRLGNDIDEIAWLKQSKANACYVKCSRWSDKFPDKSVSIGVNSDSISITDRINIDFAPPLVQLERYNMLAMIK